MELPLLSRARQGDASFALVTVDDILSSGHGSFCGALGNATLPTPPAPGEQYRFHFDMSKCIGCKCCVVACNEQNGNPADILWRRVGEIEGGTYPHTQRHYLSMGCNHCLEPTCLTGCPVDAYTKDLVTGIVRHSADACIGCQYCTWNCSYGVPQYNPDRGVVGKCDMCYGRLTLGQQPACVAACPEGAIRVETVNIVEWRNEYRNGADAPGMPSADDSLSTTRITLPKALPRDMEKVNVGRLRPEEPHTPLIIMTVLTQLSVGGFTAIWLLQSVGTQLHRVASLVALAVAMLALAASTLHLGRPIYAIRALKMWRRSWLSREVLLFSIFAVTASAYSAALWFDVRHSLVLGASAVLVGIAAVGASARLYLAPGRPAWNSPFTIAEFLMTLLLLGSCGANILTASSMSSRQALISVTILTSIIALLKLVWLSSSRVYELRGAARLQFTLLRHFLWLRIALLTATILVTLFVIASWSCFIVALIALAGEFVNRYLFFVSVVPTNMASDYLAAEAA